jgi:hypothetical protein
MTNSHEILRYICLWSQPSQNYSLKMFKLGFFFTFSNTRISITGVDLHVSVNLTFNLEEYMDLHHSAVQLFSI